MRLPIPETERLVAQMLEKNTGGTHLNTRRSGP